MKIRSTLLLLLAALAACSPVEQEPDPNVVQSFPLDTKEYRYLELDNGIRILLISDRNAVKSLASLNIEVGSYQDPEGWDGLAHFLEHMLFLGTEKYPDSAEYDEYLDANGGSHNAYTAYDATNYHFSVDNSAYEGALDRFAQFFISPLFTEKYVDREKNAVHSEYFTRIENDSIRNIEAFENTINPEHPAFKFNAGNLDTLSDKPGRPVRDELMEFHQTYYSADIMTLALVSNQSLDELEQLARGKFAAIPRRNSVQQTHFPPLFGDGQLPKVIEIKPVQESRTLTLGFPIPEQKDYARENPVGFVAAILTSKSDNSLSDRLKAKGWIQHIGARAGMNYGTTDTFVIRVILTEQGVAHQDEIIAALFDQISLVREQGVEEWRYNELKNLSEMGFRFTENRSLDMNGAVNFANALQDTLPRDLISQDFKRFDRKLINHILHRLTPDNMVVQLVAPSVVPDKETEFYGAGYRTYQPSAERIKHWQASQYSDLALAERNPLIPENFDLVDVQTTEKPLKLINTGGIELWHYPNIEDRIPKASVQLAIDRPERPTLEQNLISQLYFGLMGEQLEKLKFNANNAGVNYRVSATGVSFSGYSDKLPELADQVLAQVLKPTFNQGQFDRMMENIKRYFANYDKVDPTRGIYRDLKKLLDADSHPVEDIRAMAASITLEKVLAAPRWLFTEGRMTMMASGNISEQQTREFARQIKETLGLKATDKDIPKGQRVVKLEPTEKPDLYLSRLAHTDAAVCRYYQGRKSTREESLTLHLLTQIMHQQYFNSLRTEQQLGYIVRAGSMRSDRTPGIIFVVQSPTASATDVEAATDDFLEAFQQRLNDMTDEMLATFKRAALAQLQQPPQNVAEKVSRFWKDLRDGYPDFDSRQKAIDALKAITIKDIQAAYREVLMESPHAISVISPGAKGGVSPTVENARVFRDGKKLITRS